mgnify:CR=1 FL=1
MESAPDHLKLAKLLLHFSAQRGGDCIKMKWTDFDGPRPAGPSREDAWRGRGRAKLSHVPEAPARGAADRTAHGRDDPG